MPRKFKPGEPGGPPAPAKRYIGAYPAVLDGIKDPAGGTLLARPGEIYRIPGASHPLLVDIEDEEQPTNEDSAGDGQPEEA